MKPIWRARGVDIWAEWADAKHTRRFNRDAGDLGPVYGYLWRSFGGDYPERNGVDQIANLVDEIGRNPNSRRLIVTGWDPRQQTRSIYLHVTLCFSSKWKTPPSCIASFTSVRQMPSLVCHLTLAPTRC